MPSGDTDPVDTEQNAETGQWAGQRLHLPRGPLMRRLSPALAAAAALPLVVLTAGNALAAPAKSTTTFKDLTFVQWGGTAGYDLYTANADGSGVAMLPKGKS